MKIIKTALPIILTLLVVGCASPLQVGNQHYANGQYDLAAAQWNPLAEAGDPYAQYNLGLLWENGLGRTPKNLNEAAAWYYKSAQQNYVDAMVRLAHIQSQLGYEEASVSWYTMAARWGDIRARNALRQKSIPVPNNDLQQASIAAQQQRQQATADTIMSLIYGVTSNNSIYTPTQQSGYTPSSQSIYTPSNQSSGYSPNNASASFGVTETDSYIHGQPGTSYNRIGNTIFGSDGTSSQQIGNIRFDSDGGTTQRIGNTIFNSDGSTSQQIGDSIFNSDGSTIQRIGDTTFGSDGTTCQKIGSQTFCN